ncbi:ArsR/SmtB family transcription factor [Nocardia sp. NPDC059764]|uniref:ArsR/SmtB family transcription factor n=1 Tax=Nocardia sp. NPDC059764 TaxID=3346939 RepID=UPI00365AD736
MPNQLSSGVQPCCSPLTREPLTSDWAGDLARMFKALGDPVRLRILSLIASREGGESCVCDISPAFELSQPTISHHLKVLREAGLLDCERRGTWVHYRVIPSALAQLSAVLSPEPGVVEGSACATVDATNHLAVLQRRNP